MGNTIAQYVNRHSTNPFADTIRRGASGGLELDLGTVLSRVGASGDNERIKNLTAALGNSPTVDAFRNYSEQYFGANPRDAGYQGPSTWKPIDDLGGQVLDAALSAFNIKESGAAKAAEIAQAGRDKAKQINMGAGIASAQRNTLAAAESAAEASPASGTPDIIEGSNQEDDGGVSAGGGNDMARRRRQSYGGAGLAMRL